MQPCISPADTIERALSALAISMSRWSAEWYKLEHDWATVGSTWPPLAKNPCRPFSQREAGQAANLCGL